MISNLIKKAQHAFDPGYDDFEDEDQGQEPVASTPRSHAAERPVLTSYQGGQAAPQAPTANRYGNLGASTRGNIVGLPTAAVAAEIVLIEPRSFDEAKAVIECLRGKKAVILNLAGLAPDQSQRMVDFVSGATHMCDGHQEKIGDAIFLFSPANVSINTFDAERDWVGSQQPRDLFFRVQ